MNLEKNRQADTYSPLRLERIVLYNFKNYEELSLNFNKRLVCLLGNNGAGKTNLLDAIHYLSVTKSFFHQMDSQNTRRGSEQCSIQGEFIRNNEKETILCTIRKNQKKIVKRNFKEYDKLSDHIGLIPSVIVTPYDIELIWEGSEVRRKFMDFTIAQQSKQYLDHLIRYNHALAQRNNLLKNFSRQSLDPALLEPWDFQLIQHADVLHAMRKAFITDFTPKFEAIYHVISDGKELPEVTYESELSNENLEVLLKKNFEKDQMLERTTSGIHRDDLLFTLDQYSLKKMASQGQQKSFLFALKLAQYQFIESHLGISPILMLDDLFDKVDESRVSRILSWLNEYVHGHIFISDTHLSRIPQLLQLLNFEFEAWQVESGTIRTLHGNNF